MSDDLVKRLRNAAMKRDGFDAVYLSEPAANRIEELEAKLKGAIAECERVGRLWHDAEAKLAEVEAERDRQYDENVDRIVKEAEAYAKLAKAVEIALEECPFAWGTGSYNDWWYDRHTTLAELKGEEDE